MMENEQDKPEAKAEIVPPTRDPKTGYFLPGNRCAVGQRPSEAMIQRQQLHRAFIAAIGTDRLTQLIDHGFDVMIATNKAKELEPLMSLYFAYLFGKPTETVSLDVSNASDSPAPMLSPALLGNPEAIAALQVLRRLCVQHQQPDADRAEDE